MTNIVTIDFRGDTLFGFQKGENTFVALRPIVEAMGMDWSGQLQRVKRDPILSEGVGMIPTPFGRGGDQEAVCIKLDLLNGWLFTIDTNRIKDESVRQKVLTYQRECYRVLHDHFAGKSKPHGLGLPSDEELAQSRGAKLSQIKEVRMIFGAEAAAQLYFQFGFELVPAMIDRSRQLTLFDYEQVKSMEAGA